MACDHDNPAVVWNHDPDGPSLPAGVTIQVDPEALLASVDDAMAPVLDLVDQAVREQADRVLLGFPPKTAKVVRGSAVLVSSEPVLGGKDGQREIALSHCYQVVGQIADQPACVVDEFGDPARNSLAAAQRASVLLDHVDRPDSDQGQLLALHRAKSMIESAIWWLGRYRALKEMDARLGSL